MYRFWVSFIFYGLCMLKIEGADPGFGEITGDSNYSQLDNNTILFASTTVFCVTDNNATEVTWTYQATQTGMETPVVPAPIWDPSTGTSTLQIDIASSGYYRCNVENQSENIKYIFGAFNPDEYGVASKFTGHFTEDIDEINLLCDPQSDLISLFDVRWRISSHLLPNPLNLSNIPDDVLVVNQDNELLCVDQSNSTSLTLPNVTLRVQGPPVIILQNGTTTQHNLLPPEMNSANVRVLTPNVILETNIIGKWITPAGTEIPSKSSTFNEFTIDDVGLYRFYVANWEGNQALAIQISLSVSGSNFGEVLQRSYRLLSGNEIFYTTTLLVCATSNTTSQPVQWEHRLTQTSAATNIQATFSPQTGVSFLTILLSSEGYYMCQVGDQSYDVAIFNPDNTIIVTAAMSGMSYYYVKGIDPTSVLLLCDANNANLPLNLVKWSISGNDSENPHNLSNLNYLGATSASCQVGTTIAIVEIMLTIYEPSLTTSYPSSSLMTFTNLSPVENAISIPFFTKLIQLTANLLSGTWILPNGALVLTSSYAIPILTLTTEGRYSFNTTQTWNGENKQVFILVIAATGIPFATRQSQDVYTSQSNNTFFYRNQDLACLTDSGTQVTWNYQLTAISSKILLATTTDSEGISASTTLLPTKQGFYSCSITNKGKSETYFAGVFDPLRTAEIQDGRSYNYTVGIDSADIWLVCNPNNSNYDLREVWFSVHGFRIGNPINFNTSAGSISQGQGSFKCFYQTDTITIVTATLLFQAPSLTISYPGSNALNLNNLSPVENAIPIPFFTKQIQLATNLVSGTWVLSNGSLVLTSTYTIPILTLTTEGRYSFNTTQTWNGENKQVFILVIAATGIPFATRQSQDVYTSQSNNTFFYRNQDLACLTDSGTQVTWNYQLTAISSKILLATTTDSEGISASTTLLPTKQGFYSCSVTNKGKSETYFAGVFDPLRTAEIQDGRSYNYTVGIDNADIWLVCNPNNSNYDLREVWFSVHGFRIGNPINFNTSAGSISQGQGSFKCFYQTNTITIVTATLLFQGPPVITLTSDTTTQHNLLPPYTNSASIRVATLDVRLQTNLIGKWRLSDGAEVESNSVIISGFTLNYAGMYRFYVTNWEGNQEVAIQINISTSGSNFGELSLLRDYRLLSGNNIFYADTSLVCATNDTSKQIQWIYLHNQTSVGANIGPTYAVPNSGISVLSIVPSMPGYYRCQVDQDSYDVAIYNPNTTIIITTAMSGMSYFYIKGIDPTNILLLCDVNNTAIQLNMIKWRLSGNDHNNPINLNDLTALRATSTSCQVAVSNVITTIMLTIYGPPNITLNYDNNMIQDISDISTVIVPLFAQNVTLTTNILGNWNVGYETKRDVITIDTFSLSNEGLYYFATEYTWNGVALNASVFDLVTSGIPIAIKTGDVYNTAIVNNQILFESVTLTCTSEVYPITWNYLQSSNAGFRTEDESSSTLNGISTLDVNINKQGFYSCNIQENASTKRYTIGIFDSMTATVALSGVTYNYTIGVDREDILLLCDPKSDSINFNDVVWRLSNSNINLPNPLSVNDSKEELSFKDNEDLLCYNNDTNTEIPTYRVFVQGPPLIAISYSDTKYLFSLSNLTSITIPLLTSSIEVSINLRSGEWRRGVINSSGTYPTIQIDLFTAKHIGVYNYIFNFLDGREKELSVEINAIGPLQVIAVKNTTGYFTLQNNTFGELNTELACFASNQDADASSINWYYQEDIPSDPQMESGEYNDQLGATSINVVKRGIYTCRLQGDMLLSVWVLELDENTQILSNEDLDGDDEMTYIIGESLTLFYLNPNISLTSIRWTTDRVQNGDTDTTMEFYNNIEISNVFAQLGSGAYTFSCFYRQSPITVVGGLNLNMKDTASTNLAYNSALQGQFSDVINANFPRPQSISIPILTEKIKLTCDKSMCEWLMLRNETADYSVSDTEYIIDVLKIENQGLYSLRRNTSANVTYSTAGFMLTVTGFTRQGIISLNHSDINIRPITLFWKLETVLPDEANQTFTIFYTENGKSYIITTTDTTFNLTDLIPGQTYIVYVTLSYAYTLETSNRSVVIMVPSLPQGGILLAAIIPAFLFLMIVLVIIIIILLIIIIFKMRKRKGKAFTTLNEDNAIAKTSNSRNSKEFGYTTLDTQLDNPVYNPDLTESMTPKSKFSESDPMMQEEKKYYNITDINDPRLRPIPLDVFKRHVDQLWEKENTLEEEYDRLGGDSFRYTCDKAQIAINKYKNKYKFIYPYDKSRVVLKKQGRDAQSDYINASHIPGLYVPQCFIASQGPKENTLQDFWRMIFEQNIVNIVMVTNLKEGDKQKCEAYFPENNGEWVEYGPYKLNNIKTDISIGNITRMFKVQSSKEKVLVKHFHFTAWPDHDVPTLYDELLVFVETVQETMIPSKAPILVHCSAGVGRTGAFITLFNLRSAISRMQPISIYQVVHEMREHRPHMVQTFRQYKFIYLAVLELLLGKTSIPGEDFTNTYNSYLESDQEGYVSVFFQQFSELNYQCKKSFYLPTNAADDNPEKNPSGEIVPFDYNRVVIYSPFFPCNYINASYHEGNQFITTIHPDAYTLVDFLQMVYQTEAALVVMLATSKEKSKMLGNMSDRKAYWPNKEASLNVPPFEVSVTNSEKSMALIKQTILLKNNSEQSERTFMQVISTAWNEKGETTDLPLIVILLNFIIKYKHENPSKPIIIHCQDGIGKTGIIYTVYQCIREMKEKGQIDIFHTIKCLRRERINFVPTLTHFCSCFAVLNEYCSST